MEFFLIPLSAWWAIYQVYYFYHQGAEEILVHFVSNRFIFNHIKFLGIFIAMLTILAAITSIRFGVNFPTLLTLFIGQSIIIATCGLIFSVLFKNVETAFLIIALYVSTEAITVGKLLAWPHILLFDFPDSLKETFINSGVYIISSLLLLFITRKLVSTTERKLL